MTPSCDLFIVVGEPSGDGYGAAIAEVLLQRNPELVIAAMGGERLRAAGAEIEQGIDGLAVMGFIPGLKRLPEFLALGRRVAGVIRERRPKVVLTIDYPGFNLRLQRQLRDLRASGTRLVHVVAPQVWAWRPRRAKKIAATVDRLLCFFPFEPHLFSRFGGQADFVGHPLVDLVPEHPDTSAVDEALGFDPAEPVVMLAPGSREREIRGLLPIMDAAVRRVHATFRRESDRPVRVIIAKAPEQPHALYREYTDLPLFEGDYRILCHRATAGLVTSGTATLEAALCGLPHVICYRGDYATVRLGRHILLTDHFGLPNIVHDARVVPELLQDECEPERVAARLLGQWRAAQPQRERLLSTRDALGGMRNIRR